MRQGHEQNSLHDPLEQDIRTLFREETAGINPNEGLDRFMATVAANPKARASWWTRLNRRLADVGFSPALASTVVMLQAGVIAALLALHVQPEKEDVLDMTPRGAGVLQQEAPDFKLTVKPDTRFSELVTLLLRNHCRIIAGPSEQGELWVAVDDDAKFEEIRTALTQSALIDEVVVNR